MKDDGGFIGLEDDFMFKGPKKKDDTVWKGFNMSNKGEIGFRADHAVFKNDK